MAKKKFSEEQKRQILMAYASGEEVSAISRRYQVSTATIYKWRKESEEQADEDTRRLRELEQENARLKKMYAELSIDHEILREGYDFIKKWPAQDAKKR